MRLRVIDNITDVTAKQLCCGCGACAWADPASLQMVDDKDHGRRPVLREGKTAGQIDPQTMQLCPGARLTHRFDANDPQYISSLAAGWGPVLELWEGWATDDALRWAGSSGGGASAVALACLQSLNYAGVLHIAQRPDLPILNHTVMSTTREQLLARAGSRYAPASPCDRLDLIEQADGPCVFIGKPCDVAAVGEARQQSSGLDQNLGLTIGIFCAGTPNLKATALLLRELGVDDWRQINTLRYRGEGWPGRMKATRLADGASPTALGDPSGLSYEHGWGRILQKHRQWRCYICPDHTGEFADIAVGDPWYRPIEADEAGSSLFVIRTPRGREVFHQAMADGWIQAKPCDPQILPQSQPNLLRTRGSLAGRLLTLRLTGAGTPRYRGFATWRFWWGQLNWAEKLQSVTGTFKRIWRRKLRQRVTMRAWAEDQPILEQEDRR